MHCQIVTKVFINTQSHQITLPESPILTDHRTRKYGQRSEIKLSDWIFQVTGILLTNQSALFQHTS